jgi:hypothetical protein
MTQILRGSFFAHLPLIGLGSNSSFPMNTPAFAIDNALPKGIVQLVDEPELANKQDLPLRGFATSDPTKYKAPPGEHYREVFWQPASLTTTEILDDVEYEFSNTAESSIIPSDGHFVNNNYVWQANGSLEPTMNVTNQDAVEAHDNGDFRSGISFGVAAGTGVAFIQEDENPILSSIGYALRRFAGVLKSFGTKLRKRRSV